MSEVLLVSSMGKGYVWSELVLVSVAGVEEEECTLTRL